MKKAFFISVFLLTVMVLHAQSAFERGYVQGFKEGYCYREKIGCLPPLSPIPPLPAPHESPNSYTDGYNRGFVDGRKAAKRDQTQSNAYSEPAYSSGYQTADPRFVDFTASEDYYKMLQIKMRALEIMIERAKRYLAQGKYYDVIAESNAMLKIEPNLAIAYLLKSIAYYRKGQILSAFNAAGRAVRLYDGKEYVEWWKEMNGEMHDYLKKLMSEEKYREVLFVTRAMQYNRRLKNLYRGMAMYYMDRKKSKKYLKKVKDIDVARMYLDAIKKKKYVPNPFKKENSQNH